MEREESEEEGKDRRKERKVWEREMHKSLQDRRGWGFPRQGLRLDQMQRTMGPEGKGEGSQSGQTGP
jgi:hypothetical protein